MLWYKAVIICWGFCHLDTWENGVSKNRQEKGREEEKGHALGKRLMGYLPKIPHHSLGRLIKAPEKWKPSPFKCLFCLLVAGDSGGSTACAAGWRYSVWGRAWLSGLGAQG